ncbi:MAG: SurA N-terminal domain-containing protein [Acidobacteria bacterium]|nr:SurA N-terminal domain-containing protein [Acidobacteriota bacterium]
MRTCLLLTVFFLSPLRAEIVDRILAVVGDQVVTWSDVMEEANYQAFLNGRQPPDSAELDRKENRQPILSRLIDQTLLAQAQKAFSFAPSENGEAKKRLEELRKQFTDEQTYRSALVRCHLTEAELVSLLERETTLMAFVDYRLHPQVQLTVEEIEQYYRETLLPELRRRGQQDVPPLSEVRDQIEQILTQEKINDLLDQWLQDLRRRTPVKILD